MSKLVCQGAVLMCSQGLTPCPLNVITNQTVLTNGRPAATINDISPASIPTFGTCQILTAAAAGVPQPCVPKIVGPWMPGSPTVNIQGQPALNNSSKAICGCGGVVSVNFPGQINVDVP